MVESAIPKTTTEVLLRPPWNFEIDYDGQGGDVPILFTYPMLPTAKRPAYLVPDYTALDEEAFAGAAGTSPILAKFVPVPLGTSMLFLFPWVARDIDEEALVNIVYVWRILWRWRSTGSYVNVSAGNRKQYVIPRTSFGIPDTRVGTDPRTGNPVTGNRYVLPSGVESAVYAKTEPYMVNEQGPVFGSILPDAVSIPNSPGMATTTARMPGANAAGPGDITRMDYSQGIIDRAAEEELLTNKEFFHIAKWIKSIGTEFAVECYKYEYDDPQNPATYTPRDWNFNVDANGVPVDPCEDFYFSVLFGIGTDTNPAYEPSSYTGVRVIWGTAPL